MRRKLRWLGIFAVVFVGLFALAAGVVHSAGGRKLSRTYPIPAITPPVIPTDSATIARGEHIVRAISVCVDCHGPDLGGQVAMDAGPVGTIVAPNLTRGKGGIGNSFTDEDWIRAIWYGLRKDGTSLLLMPSESYTHMSRADLTAAVAYLKQIPPVDRELPPTRIRLFGRALLAAGQLPLIVAELMPRVEQPDDVPFSVTAEYGEYLAHVGGCKGCHGPDLTGGIVVGPPDSPPTANLTPVGLGSWSEEDFFRAMRVGTRPDGSRISEVMPWRSMASLTDDELRALWAYLETVPPAETQIR